MGPLRLIRHRSSRAVGYARQYTDRESGLQYLRARYYDPASEQFLTSDPLQELTLAPYSYAGGDAMNGTDPSGLFGWGDIRNFGVRVVAWGVKTTGDWIGSSYDELTSSSWKTKAYGAWDVASWTGGWFVGGGEARGALEAGDLATHVLPEAGQAVECPIQAAENIAATASSALHGNSLASSRPTSLYELSTKGGEYLKTGITSEPIPENRYTKAFMEGKKMNILDTGSRAEMAAKERRIVEENPGPLNREPWAGKKRP